MLIEVAKEQVLRMSQKQTYKINFRLNRTFIKIERELEQLQHNISYYTKNLNFHMRCYNSKKYFETKMKSYIKIYMQSAKRKNFMKQKKINLDQGTRNKKIETVLNKMEKYQLFMIKQAISMIIERVQTKPKTFKKKRYIFSSTLHFWRNIIQNKKIYKNIWKNLTYFYSKNDEKTWKILNQRFSISLELVWFQTREAISLISTC